MPIADDIAAIRADPNRTNDQKRRAVHALKASEMYSAILPLLGSTFIFNQIDWTPKEVWLEDGGETLCFQVLATQTTGSRQAGFDTNTRVHPSTVHKFTNPGVLANDKSDNRIQAAKEMLASLL